MTRDGTSVRANHAAARINPKSASVYFGRGHSFPMTTTTTVRARRAPAAPARTLRAFTLVELLVVIGVIGLLIGLLLPALGKVVERARSTTTTGTMQEFAKACDAYFQEFSEYPGAIPDEYLYAAGNDSTVPVISGTGNALLALMGGSRVPSDPDYATYTGTVVTLTANGLPNFVIKIDPTRMGEGPMRNGKKYDPFYAPKGKEFAITTGRAPPTTGTDPKLPDLVDAWGQPIIFIKQQRTMGSLVPNGTDPGQFNRWGMLPYTLSTSLGELSQDQTTANNPTKYSLFNTSSAGGKSGADARNLTLGQLIRHAALNVQNGSASDTDKVYAGTARGRYFLFSAGADGVYFSVAQGYGTNSAPKADIVSLGQNADGPNVAARFDDLIVTGGS